MKKSLAAKFAFLQPVKDDLEIKEWSEDDSINKVESKFDTILSEIFAVDPISGLPKGDISYYLTSDANPQVREWIKNNLLIPRSVLSGADPSKVSDDLIAECSRIDGENLEDYASRLSAIRTEAEANIKKFQTELKNQNQ